MSILGREWACMYQGVHTHTWVRTRDSRASRQLYYGIASQVLVFSHLCGCYVLTCRMKVYSPTLGGREGLFPLTTTRTTVKGESPSQIALESGSWPREAEPAALSWTGWTVHFQLGKLLFLLRADIWVANDLGKFSFLGITVWVVWGRGGGGVGRGN